MQGGRETAVALSRGRLENIGSGARHISALGVLAVAVAVCSASLLL